LPRVLESLSKAGKGLFIMAGPARSGISTSLAAFLEKMNQSRACHILVIEDPIEFYFEPKMSRISQRQFRKDLFSIEQGLNFAKRMDVDVMAIGDLKCEVPFRALLDYVAGGHSVVLSMQTLGIVNTLEKILFSFPEKDRDHAGNVLASNLLGVCSQALLLGTGGQKMVPAHEILVVNPTTRGILQKGRISQLEPNIRSAGEGSQLFEQDTGRLLREGAVPRETVEAFLAMYRGVKA
jgi:twitching motility protein PilT